MIEHQHLWWGDDEEMAANGVNLDALIPREDFAAIGEPPRGNPMGTLSIATLADEFFVSSLRKPDFQRETTSWNPRKIVDLVAAFLDGDLIPAIILWRSGQYVFVIDGAHRVSAILAWMYDDYGDKSRSINFFENQIPEEQVKLAKQTRELIFSTVGSYASFRDASKSSAYMSDKMKDRLGGLASNSFVAQWVPAVDAEGAENSFFRINQAPTPVDPVEKRILKGRMAPNAIASRAINRGGVGHRYWGHFSEEAQAEIEALGQEIHTALYHPPLGGDSVKSSDVPVGGRGYSSLPFVFDLVNLVNEVGNRDKVAKDEDGSLTIEYMRKVKKRIERITTNHPGSLGLHPLVYFYTRGGAFQPIAFLAVAEVVDSLVQSNKLDQFCHVRRDFESFLMEYKEAFTLIVKSQGSGRRSLPALEAFLEIALRELWNGATKDDIVSSMAEDSRFRFFTTPAPIRGGGGTGRKFDASAKSAAFVANLTENGVRCGICGGLIHRNSMSADHVVRRQDGGGNHSGNAQVTHPYCNSGLKERAVSQVATEGS